MPTTRKFREGYCPSCETRTTWHKGRMVAWKVWMCDVCNNVVRKVEAQ